MLFGAGFGDVVQPAVRSLAAPSTAGHWARHQPAESYLERCEMAGSQIWPIWRMDGARHYRIMVHARYIIERSI